MISIVVGAQYGGEGKGKVAAYLAMKNRPHCTLRCGGPNSSHTVVWKGRTFRLRMMPAAAVVNPKIEVCFGAGTLIHIPTLKQEARDIGYQGVLRIDNQAGIITEDIIREQREDPRYALIGSTMTGTGYASARRCLRKLKLAREFAELSGSLVNISELLQEKIAKGKHILVEGHQGYGLSNYHGDYPYTSSRDSTASSMLAEIGLGPIQKAMKVILVAKMFPTRNHPGKLDDEITTAEADALRIVEFGGGSWGVKDQRRRVGLLDFDIIKRAVVANSATEIALTGVDHYLRTFAVPQDGGAHLIQTIRDLERETGIIVQYLSGGSDTACMQEIHDLGESSSDRQLSRTLIDRYSDQGGTL
jgi:adenylosuccinate synthase